MTKRVLAITLAVSILLGMFAMNASAVPEKDASAGSFTVNMYDSYGDSWNGNAIYVYDGDELVQTLTVGSGSEATATIEYELCKEYKFVWSEGSYAYECSFEILRGEEVLYSNDGAESLYHGVVFYIFNSHDVVDGSCSVCGKSEFDEPSAPITYEVENGNIYFFKDEGLIFDADSYITAADIPSEIDGVAVTTIGENAFYNCDDLVSVTIPDSVTTIADRAFYNCAGLSYLTFGKGVTYVGNAVFYGCDNLDHVFYTGTQAQWNSIVIMEGDNYNLTSATRHCEVDGSKITEEESCIYALTKCAICNQTIRRLSIDPTNHDYVDGICTKCGVPDYLSYDIASDNTVTITDCDTYVTDVVIPAVIDGLPVTTIRYYAFWNCINLTNVTIPDSVTTIDDQAFYGCSSLQSVSISKNVEYIGYMAFIYCYSLEAIRVDEANPYYSSDANGILFDKNKTELIQCPAAYSGAYTIPGTVTIIGHHAFTCCKNLTSVTIGNKVTSIDSSAFSNCEKLSSVTIPDSVTQIGDRAFAGCSALTSVTLSKSLTSISDYMFRGCTALTDISIPENVTMIGYHAFDSCSALTSVTIPENVTTIEYHAFAHCSALTSATIGSTVSYIEEYAFVGCVSLDKFIVSAQNESYSSDANGLLYNKDKTLLIMCPGGKEVCEIPASVCDIESTAFYSCSKLRAFSVAANNAYYSAHESGLLLNKAGTSLVTCPPAWIICEVPEGITTLAYEAFNNCEGLRVICLPKSLTTIDDKVFDHYSKIDHIIYAGTETQWGSVSYDTYFNDYLDYYTFHYEATSDILTTVQTCRHKLISCSLCDNTVAIEELPNSKHSFSGGKCTVCGVPSYLNYRVETDGVYIEGYDGSVADIEIPNTIETVGVKTIERNAFKDESTLKTVDFGDSVTNIGYQAFMNCTALNKLTLPEDLESIDAGAFYNCESLPNVQIGKAVKWMGDDAFHQCDNLEGISVDPENEYFVNDEYGVLYNKSYSALFVAGKNIPKIYLTHPSTAFIAAEAFAVCNHLELLSVLNPRGTIGSSGPDITPLPKRTTLHGETDSAIEAYANEHDRSFCAHSYDGEICTICGAGGMVWEGVCGENLTWRLTEADGHLVISGSGEMYHFSDWAAWGGCARHIAKVTMPEGMTSIGALAFENCVKLEKISIPDSVLTVGDNAFLGCENLARVDFGEGVESIGYQAFGLCAALTDVSLPASVTSIYNNAFAESSLKSIEIPNEACWIDPSAYTLGDPETTVIYGIPGSTAEDYANTYGYIFKTLCAHSYEGVVTAPTCTEDGYTTFTCTVCGRTYIGDDVDATGHSFGEWKLTKAATCTRAGTSRRDCADCDAFEERTDAALGHDFGEWTVIKAATCTENGTSRRSCSRCEAKEERADEATGHVYETSVVAPTCTEKGHTVYTCICGDSFNDSEVNALGHSFGDWKVSATATCTAKGEEYRECSRCGGKEERQTNLIAHNYVNGTCSVCGEKKPSDEPEIPTENPFTDVKESDYFAMPVLWAVGKGITNGLSATSFGPNENCTRGQIVTFLWRANGSPEPTKNDNPFKDVKSSDYFYKAVLWAVEKGITTGLSATSFGPNATCTRGQVATFLWRAQGEPAPQSTNNPFSDVKTSDYYYKAVLWAVENNVTQGMGGGKFAPNASCTRGQIVTFLYRAIA